MSPFAAPDAPFLLAMTAPADGTAPFWVQLVPFAMILGIFYFVILLPMRKRQKKVQAFQDALKVGDRVITTSGIYGSITEDPRPIDPVADRRKGAHRSRQVLGGRLSGRGAGRPRTGSHVTQNRCERPTGRSPPSRTRAAPVP